jgi:hypothetical protein
METISTISTISVDNESNITIDDITIFYKNKFIDYSLIHISYNNITKINIPENVKYIGRILYFDLWLEKKYKIYLIGLPNSPIKSWYKIRNINEIELFEKFFSDEKMDLYNEIGFIIDLTTNNGFNGLNGLNGINTMITKFTDFIKYIYLHEFTEKQIFESKKDLKNIIKNTKLLYDDEIRILNNFILSNQNSFYIRLKYSKSIIFCEAHDNNISVKVFYNELKMRNRFDKWPKFLPSDVSLLFSSFNLIFPEDILEKIESNEKNIMITNLEIDTLFKFYPDKNKLKKKINLKKFKNKEQLLYITGKLEQLECDEIFQKIEKEGIFKAFENSFDILLETFYEKINHNEDVSNQTMYLNDKLKNKLDMIFKTKLI